MKIYLALLVSSLLPGRILAQRVVAAALPEAVRVAFKRAQPQATTVSWHQSGTSYEARFRQQQGWSAVLLTPAGKVLETQTDVAHADFPPLGRTAMSQRFPHRQLDRITKVEKASGETTYVVQVCQGKDKNGKDKNCQTSVFDDSGRPKSN